MLSWKLGPALAAGNTVVLKPSEFTALSAIRVSLLIVEAGFPPGVVNIVTGFGNTAGAAITSHPKINKVAFTGSTLVGRAVMKAAAESNLNNVTLELGTPFRPLGTIANRGIKRFTQVESLPVSSLRTLIWTKQLNGLLSEYCKPTTFPNYPPGVLTFPNSLSFNHGQCCCAGSRIFVQESIYDRFLAAFSEHIKSIKVGDPFEADTFQGPQVSKIQFDVRLLLVSFNIFLDCISLAYNDLHRIWEGRRRYCPRWRR
jgi:aldehyde dehydrogenase (NAD+)